MRPHFGGPLKKKMSTPVMHETGNRTFDIAWVREQFPSLKLQVNGQAAAFLDGPAGTQVPKQVMDAVQNYFLNDNANTNDDILTRRRQVDMIITTKPFVEDTCRGRWILVEHSCNDQSGCGN